MNIKCKKCGCDTLIKSGDWLRCPNCGTVMFDTAVTVNNGVSPTKELEKIDSGKPYTPAAEKKSTISFASPVQSSDNAKAVKSSALKLTEQENEGVRLNQPEQIQDAADNRENDVDNTESKEDKKSKKKKRDRKKAEEDKPPKSKRRETVEFFTPIVIALVIAVFLKSFIFANAVVPTGSMLNTIQEGDRIIASRIEYVTNEPERYDIIIFKYPDDEKQKFVKRIIGLPGETVEIIGGTVYVTKADSETIILKDDFVTACTPKGNYGPFDVPDNCYFVMGDNRNSSWDSRFWNNTYVQRDKILGKVKFKYFPKISEIK